MLKVPWSACQNNLYFLQNVDILIQVPLSEGQMWDFCTSLHNMSKSFDILNVVVGYFHHILKNILQKHNVTGRRSCIIQISLKMAMKWMTASNMNRIRKTTYEKTFQNPDRKQVKYRSISRDISWQTGQKKLRIVFVFFLIFDHKKRGRHVMLVDV